MNQTAIQPRSVRVAHYLVKYKYIFLKHRGQRPTVLHHPVINLFVGTNIRLSLKPQSLHAG